MEKLQKWSLIAEIAAAIAVVLSIIYLAVEVQRNTSAIRTQTHQGLLELSNYNNIEFVTNPEMADLIFRGDRNFDELTDVEQSRYRFFIQSENNIWEHAFNSHLNGTMDSRTWEGYDVSYRRNFCKKSGNIVWRQMEQDFGAEFRAHVNATSKEDCAETGF